MVVAPNFNLTVLSLATADDGIPSMLVTNCTLDMITKGGGNSINAPLEFTVHNGEISYNHIVGGRFAYIVGWNPGETLQQKNLQVHHNSFYLVGHVNSPTGIVRSSYNGWNGLFIYNNTIHIPPTMNYNVAIVYNGAGGVTYNSTNVQVKNNVMSVSEAAVDPAELY